MLLLLPLSPPAPPPLTHSCSHLLLHSTTGEFFRCLNCPNHNRYASDSITCDRNAQQATGPGAATRAQSNRDSGSGESSSLSQILSPKSTANEITTRATVSGHVPDRVRSTMGSTAGKGKGLAKRGRHGARRSSVFLEGGGCGSMGGWPIVPVSEFSICCSHPPISKQGARGAFDVIRVYLSGVTSFNRLSRRMFYSRIRTTVPLAKHLDLIHHVYKALKKSVMRELFSVETPDILSLDRSSVDVTRATR